MRGSTNARKWVQSILAIANMRGWVLSAMLLATGCGSPAQVGPNNYRLVAALQTAISARRTDWLDDAQKEVTERRARGQLDDQQFAALDAIITQARAGQWEAAQSEIAQLAKAQRATPDELQQLKSSKTAPRNK
jgi:hypothetical protein